jgi:Domain of unknown function (DUF397)
MMARGALVFAKSSFSMSGNCVCWAFEGSIVFVGDTKEPEGLLFFLTEREWLRFTHAVRTGVPSTVRLRWNATSTGVSLLDADYPTEYLHFSHSEWRAFEQAIRASEVYRRAAS